jgi:hypothetical protein
MADVEDELFLLRQAADKAVAERAESERASAETAQRERRLKLESETAERAAERGAAEEEAPGEGGQGDVWGAQDVTSERGGAGDPVLVFQAQPLKQEPPPTTEQLGHPNAAKEKGEKKRREEAELEAKQREPHEGGRIWARHGTGSTPFSYRLKHQPIEMFTETSEDYHSIPPVLDYPVQALNPALQVCV